MKKILVVAALAASGAMAMCATPAEAKVRLTVNTWGVPYFVYYPPHHHRRYVPPPDVYDSSYYDDYGDQAFDESYYDPYYLPPSEQPVLRKTKRLPQANVKPKAKPVVASTRPVTLKTTTKPKQVASVAPSPKPATQAMSCDKATGVVSGYGFSSVTPQDCQGQVYEFAATRDGKKFLIKVSASTGELTDVKKIN